MDLLSNYSFDQVCRLVELRKHLCASDRHVMVDHIIHQLSIAHLFQVTCQPPPLPSLYYLTCLYYLPSIILPASITFPLLSYLPLLPSLSYLTCLYYLPSLILPASIIFPLFWNGATMPSTTL